MQNKNDRHGSLWRDLFDPGNLMLLVYILVMLIILIFGSVRSGGALELVNEAIGADQPRQGELFIKDPEGRLQPAPRLNQNVAMEISGLVARVHLQQRFTNDSGDWGEATYVFPLPPDCSIDNMQLRIGERVIDGRIMEKHQAAEVHDKARREGRKSGLLSQQRPNIFTTRVANVGPGEEVVVELAYQQLVRFESGIFSLRFPMVVGPRYIPGKVLVGGGAEPVRVAGSGWGSDTDQVPDGSRITPPVDLDGHSHLPVSMTIDLAAGFPVGMIESLYHGIRRERLGVDRYRLELTGRVKADRDFVLRWGPQQESGVGAALFAESREQEQYLLLMLMPPQQRPVERLAREVVFVVDISGSMAGTSIDQAKAALSLGLDQLTASDRFNIIAFNNSVVSLFSAPQSAGVENRQKGLRFVDGLMASGGTEMKPALRRALDGSSRHELLRQVIFLTDGSVGNEEELFALIDRRLGDSRLFPVGIGSAPNSYFMHRAAVIGRGTFTYIGHQAEVQLTMTMLLEKIAHPVITDLVLGVAEDSPEVEMYPQRIPDLYLGEPLVVTIRTAWKNGSLAIRGNHFGTPWQKVVDLSAYGERQGIAKLWARKKITALMESMALGGNPEEYRRAVLQTALDHQVMSRYTSFVAVDHQVSRPTEKQLQQQPVATHLPHGWQKEAVFGGMAQTATPASQRIIVGLLLLVMSGVAVVCGKLKVAECTD